MIKFHKVHEVQTSGDIDICTYTTRLCIADPRYTEVASDLVILEKVAILRRHLRHLSQIMAVNPAASAMDVGTLSVTALPSLPSAKVMKALDTLQLTAR